MARIRFLLVLSQALTDNTVGEVMRKILVLSMLALLPSCAKESELEPIVDAYAVKADSATPEKPLLSLPDFEAGQEASNKPEFNPLSSRDPFQVLNINVVDPTRNQQSRYFEVLIRFYHDHNGAQPDGISPPARPDVLQGFDYVINWDEGAVEQTNTQSGVLWVWNIADSTIVIYDKSGKKGASVILKLAKSRYGYREGKLVPWGMDPRPYIPKSK